MAQSKVITLANQKGGTGKTTTAYNLGYALAEMGKRVLLVDFDPQSNLTGYFTTETELKDHLTIPRLLAALMAIDDTSENETLPDMRQAVISGSAMDILPSTLDLSVEETNLNNEMGSEYFLDRILDPLRPDYDYIIIDTNPSLGKLTINALVACDSVIIPACPELWSATGLNALVQNIMRVKKRLNRRIVVDGILLTSCDERTRLFHKAKDLIEEYFYALKVFEARIPRSTKVGEANFNAQGITEFCKTNIASQAYAAFAKEVSENERKAGNE